MADKIIIEDAMKKLEVRNIKEAGVLQLLNKYLKVNKKDYPYLISELMTDDCSIIDVGSDKYITISTDRVSSRPLAARLGLIGYKELGHYVVYANISDVASSGSDPLGLLIALGLPFSFKISDLEELIKGIKEACDYYGTCVLGGDTNYTKDLSLVATSIGIVDKDALMPRFGAKKDDIIAVTGYVGTFTAAGYAFIKKIEMSNKIRDLFIDALKYPKVPLREAKLVAKHKGGHAGIDISDGLGVDLKKIADESGVGMRIYEKKLPIKQEVREFALSLNKNPSDFAFGIGGDWQIIFTIKPQKWDLIKHEINKAGGRLTEIGYIIEEKKLEMVTKNGEIKPLETRGHDDFGFKTFEEEILSYYE